VFSLRSLSFFFLPHVGQGEFPGEYTACMRRPVLLFSRARLQSKTGMAGRHSLSFPMTPSPLPPLERDVLGPRRSVVSFPYKSTTTGMPEPDQAADFFSFFVNVNLSSP